MKLAFPTKRFPFYCPMKYAKLFVMLEKHRPVNSKCFDDSRTFEPTPKNSKEVTSFNLECPLHLCVQFSLSMTGGLAGPDIEAFWKHCFKHQEWRNHPAKFMSNLEWDRFLFAIPKKRVPVCSSVQKHSVGIRTHPHCLPR